MKRTPRGRISASLLALFVAGAAGSSRAEAAPAADDDARTEEAPKSATSAHVPGVGDEPTRRPERPGAKEAPEGAREPESARAPEPAKPGEATRPPTGPDERPPQAPPSGPSEGPSEPTTTPSPIVRPPPSERPPEPEPVLETRPEAAASPGDGAERVLSTADEERATKRLRLPNAIDLALRQHPQLKAARDQTRAAEARVGRAQSRYLPRIDSTLQYVRGSENGSIASFHSVPGMARVGSATRDGVEWNDSFNNFLAAVVAQQAIYDFGRTQGMVGAARAEVKAAKMNEELLEQLVVFGVIRSYYDVRNARESVRVAEEALNNATAILELAQAGTGSGLRPPSEKARAEADVAAAEVALIRARLDLEVAGARVANAVGATGEAIEPATEALPAPAPVPDVEDAIDLALTNRPELRALDFRREALAQTLRSVSARQYPRLDALLGASSRGQFLTGHGQEPHQSFNWHAGVIVSIPIFQGLAVRREKEELRALMSALGSQREAVAEAVILEVKEAVAVVRAADEAERASRKQVEAAKVALEVSQGRYRAGLGTLIELTDAQATYVAARSQAVQGRYDRLLARAALGLATGTAGSSIDAPAEVRPGAE